LRRFSSVPLFEEPIVDVTTTKYRPDLSNARWMRSTQATAGTDNCVEVAFVGDAIAVRESGGGSPALIFTPAEWDAFVGGAKDGEFNL
jgi:hypothetical protein